MSLRPRMANASSHARLLTAAAFTSGISVEEGVTGRQGHGFVPQEKREVVSRVGLEATRLWSIKYQAGQLLGEGGCSCVTRGSECH